MDTACSEPYGESTFFFFLISKKKTNYTMCSAYHEPLGGWTMCNTEYMIQFYLDEVGIITFINISILSFSIIF